MDAGRCVGVYEIGGLLGAGGMGEVYRARDTKLGRAVAIKFLPRDSERDPDRLRRFINEARAASALNHPNILTIHEIGEADGRPFIAMELIEGQTLRDRLRSGPLTLVEALDLAGQIALALAAAHEKGVVHGDIKPENVMLRPDGYAKVLDFGLATLRAAPKDGALTAGAFETVAATVAGTMAYMPPEQIEGHQPDSRTDIFAFGVVLCELTTGTNPFARPSAIETLSAIGKTPAAAAPLTAGLAPGVAHVITKALAKRPEDRYQAMTEVLVDLRLSQAQIATGVDTEAPARGTRRRTVLIGAVVLALVVVVAVGVALKVFSDGSGGELESIAVLPFVNANADPQTEYLSQGIASDIVNSLTQLHLPKLRIVPWSAVSRRYMGRRVDPLEVGRALRVRMVLVGTVTQRANDLELEMELVDVVQIAQLWGHQYQRRLSDIVPMRQQVVQDIVNQLRVKLTSEDRTRLAKHDTENSQAHLAYLQGRNHSDKRTPDELQLARLYFQQAIKLDLNYAQAYASLAFAETALSRRAMVSPKEAYPLAKSAAAKALQIDDELAEAHWAMATVKMDFERDWSGAELEFKRAFAIDPTSVDAHHRYAHLLEALKRPQESLAETERALEIDPLDPLLNAHLGWHYLSVGEFDRAVAQCHKALDIGETYFGHFYLGRTYEQLGRYEEAVAELTKAHVMAKGDTEAMAAIGHTYAVSGKRRDAQRVIEDLDRLSTQRYVSQGYKALIYAGLGKTEPAFEWLQRAYGEGSEWLMYLDIDRRYNTLRADPRFDDLLRHLGLGRRAAGPA